MKQAHLNDLHECKGRRSSVQFHVFTFKDVRMCMLSQADLGMSIAGCV